MRKRILFTVGGAILGVLVAAPVQDYFRIGGALANGVCASFGLVIGFMVSTLVDAFSVSGNQS